MAQGSWVRVLHPVSFFFFPFCSPFPMSASIARAGVGCFSLCALIPFLFFATPRGGLGSSSYWSHPAHIRASYVTLRPSSLSALPRPSLGGAPFNRLPQIRFPPPISVSFLAISLTFGVSLLFSLSPHHSAATSCLPS